MPAAAVTELIEAELVADLDEDLGSEA